jgi:hypothetical protein
LQVPALQVSAPLHKSPSSQLLVLSGVPTQAPAEQASSVQASPSSQASVLFV